MIFLYIFWILIIMTILGAMTYLLGRNAKKQFESDYNPPFYTKDNWYHVLNPNANDMLIDSTEMDYQWYNEE